MSARRRRAALPQPGARFVLTRPVDRFPVFSTPAGAAGTVVLSEQELITLHMDAHIPGAEPWNNDIAWTTDEDVGAGVPSAARAFAADTTLLIEPAVPESPESVELARWRPRRCSRATRHRGFIWCAARQRRAPAVTSRSITVARRSGTSPTLTLPPTGTMGRRRSIGTR